jgi:hypothetical protein
MRRQRPALLLLISCLAWTACRGSGATTERPPENRIAEVVDTIHGEPFAGPYRWLEDQAAPDAR